MKIVLLDSDTMGNIPEIKELGAFGELEVYGVTFPEETTERCREADIVISNKVHITREVMENCPQLKLICIAATGMNNVDLDAAKEKGIPVKNVEDYSTESVAQHTFALLLSLMESIRYYDDYVKSGEYSKSPIFNHIGRPFYELSGKRFGIIGLGDIGKQVASIAEAFGTNVQYYSTSGKNKNAAYNQVSLEELMQTSDVISIHAPLNDNTRDLIGKTLLQQAKPTAYLLNTGRGGIVNETALAKALDEDWIAGAGLDVLTQEPIQSDNPLMQVQKKEKLIITPHIAWTSIEARQRLVQKLKGNINEFLEMGE